MNSKKPTRWGSCGQLMTRDAHSQDPNQPPDMETADKMNALEKEIGYLRDIADRQNILIQRFGDRLLLHPPSVVGASNIKPRDIPILELNQLQGLNATTQLQIFFELVEQCSDSDLRRVQIAKSRVSPELAALIHNHQTQHHCDTWVDLKQLLRTEFSTDVNFDRAWQEMDSAKYDWAESPQAFSNNFICQYPILETRFAREKLPNRDKTIKRKLWQGLTPESKARLEGFLDEDYPQTKFIDRVEHERQWLEAKHSSSLYRIRDEKKPSTTSEVTTTCIALVKHQNQRLHPVNPQKLMNLKSRLGT